MIHIARIIRDLADLEEVLVHTGPTAEFLKFRRADHVDEGHLGRIRESRASEPLLLAEIADETWVLDGNHRLEARHRAGEETTDAIFIGDLRPYVEPLGF